MTAARRIGLVLAGLACVLLVVVGVAWAKGYRVYVIHTASMEPALPVGAAVFTHPVNGPLKAGEVITFLHGQGSDLVTHRITGFSSSGLIHTKGDANPSPDAWEIRPDQVKGVQAVHVPRLGYLLVFLQQPAGDASVVAGLFAVFLLWALFFPSAEPVRRHAAHRATRARANRGRATRGRRATEPAVAPHTSFAIRSIPALSEMRLDDAPTATMSRSDIDALRELLRAPAG